MSVQMAASDISTPKTRMIQVMIRVLISRCCGVGGGESTPEWRWRNPVVHALYLSDISRDQTSIAAPHTTQPLDTATTIHFSIAGVREKASRYLQGYATSRRQETPA
jgi:hypothetical protein